MPKILPVELNSKKTALCIIIYLAVWLVGSYLINNSHDLYVDVLENITWSNHLKITYEKHPGLGAAFLKLILYFITNPLLASLVASATCMLVSLAFTFKTMRLYLTKDESLFLIIIISLSSIYTDYSFVQYNQNVILLPFWVMSCYYFSLVLKNNALKYWVLLAAVCSLSVYAKFEVGLLFIVFATYMLFNFKRKYLTNFVISAILFLLFLIPLFIALFENNFAPIRYALDGNVNNTESTSIIYKLLFAQVFNLSSLGYVAVPLLFTIFLIFKKRVYIDKYSSFIRKLGHPLVVFGVYPLLIFAVLQTIAIHLEYGWLLVILSMSVPGFYYLFDFKIKPTVFKNIIVYALLIHATVFIVYNSFIYFGPTVTTRNYGNEVAIEAQQFIARNHKTGQINHIIGNTPHYNQLSLSVAAFLKSKPYANISFNDPLVPYNETSLAVFADCSPQNEQYMLSSGYTFTAHECINIKSTGEYKTVSRDISFYLVRKTEPSSNSKQS